MVYQNIVTGIMLMICTMEDLKDRRIRSSSLILYTVLVLAGKPENIAAGSVPGSLCLILSCLSRQKLGYGDSLFILISGISLGTVQGFQMVLHAFLLSGIWSVEYLIIGKTERSREIPFFPFLLAGWVKTVWITH